MTKHLMDTLNFIPDVEFIAGEGAKLYDEDGEEWIDFFTDVGTASLGYCPVEGNDALVAAVMGNVPVHAPNLYHFKQRSWAAKRMCDVHHMDKAFFCNSGTEAVEAAIKIARLKHWHDWMGMRRLDNRLVAGVVTRAQVFTVADSFHGRTLGSLAAGDGPDYHRNGQGPMPGGFYKFNAIDQIPKDAAAVLIAPVFGNNDVREYEYEWLVELRRYTEDNNIALIFDEVQSGSGRCAWPSYSCSLNIKPDIITFAKGVAMGHPMGVTLARDSYANAITPGRHFSTFGGSPLGASMLLAMNDWMEESGNLEGVYRRGDSIRGALEGAGCKGVRGPGMLIAFDFEGDCLKLAEECRKRKLLIGAFRPGPGPVKITPPLNIAHDELELGLERLKSALQV